MSLGIDQKHFINKRETNEQQERVSKIVQGQSGNNSSCVENFGGVQIPKLGPLGTVTLNISG